MTVPQTDSGRRVEYTKALERTLVKELCKFRGANYEYPARGAEQLIPRFQEKSLSFRCVLTVPQTDTGGQVENTKALERTVAKELCKLTP